MYEKEMDSWVIFSIKQGKSVQASMGNYGPSESVSVYFSTHGGPDVKVTMLVPKDEAEKRTAREVLDKFFFNKDELYKISHTGCRISGKENEGPLAEPVKEGEYRALIMGMIERERKGDNFWEENKICPEDKLEKFGYRVELKV